MRAGVLIARVEQELGRIQQKLRARPEGEGLLTIHACRVLGGHGLLPTVGEIWRIVFGDDAVVLRDFRSHEARVNYADVTALEVGGPGETTSGGGFIGGGFGLEGAAIGMLVAATANELTTKTSIDAVIYLQTRDAELFFHHSGTTPEALRWVLSPVFSKLRALQPPSEHSAKTDGSVVADQLSKVADLHERGLLTDEEFASAKARILGNG